jgi:hypothetical protein
MKIWRSGGLVPSFLTSALDGGEWLTSRPGYPNPGTSPPEPIGWDTGWSPEPVWTLWNREKSCSAGKLTQFFEPVTCRYTK